MNSESIRSAICLSAILLSFGTSSGDAQANVGMNTSASAEIDTFFITSLAKSGQASAQLILGEMHLTGKGLPLDYSEALKWFRAAAEQGETEALRRLGFMYESGLGVKRDLAQADLLYDLAAKGGDLISSYMFGLGYMGMNVP
jgi:TPR repeat protein